MKSSTAATFMVLICIGWYAYSGAHHVTVAQQAQHFPQNCPTVSVSCPSELDFSAPLVFSANVQADATIKPTFKWEISAGSIISGQGTSILVVDASLVSSEITATVTLGGYPSACRTEASCSLMVCGLAPPPLKLESYSPSNAESIWDSFATQLENNPTARGLIHSYGSKRGYRGAALAHAKMVKQYLIKKGIADDRILVEDAGYKENANVELWIIPAASHTPSPTPTVSAQDVEFIEPQQRTRPTKRSPKI